MFLLLFKTVQNKRASLAWQWLTEGYDGVFPGESTEEVIASEGEGTQNVWQV